MEWTVLLPLKYSSVAKSRLVAASVDAAAHAALVAAIRTDTLRATRRAAPVARVVLVVDRPRGGTGSPGTPPPDLTSAAPDTSDVAAEVCEFVQSGSGLNAALREAAAHAGTRWPGDGCAALVGDLPSLRPGELAAALAAAASHPRTFVADAEGSGTTLLTARNPFELRPQFGTGSAARHALDAHAIDAAAGLRRDVDTAADLRAAVELGVGAATADVLGVLGHDPNPRRTPA